MTTVLLGMALAALPFAVIGALLALAAAAERRRARRAARQVALTEAVHRELGAAAAPVVTRRFGGRWRVLLSAPLDRPATVGALVRIVHQVSTGWSGMGPVEIVLTAEPERLPTLPPSRFGHAPVPRAVRGGR